MSVGGDSKLGSELAFAEIVPVRGSELLRLVLVLVDWTWVVGVTGDHCDLVAHQGLLLHE